MPESKVLGVDFQDGFVNDTVVLKIEGNEVFREAHLSTSILLGLAGSFKTEVEAERISVEVEIPTKNLERVIEVDVLEDVYLGISVVDNSIDYVVSDEPFGYF